MKILKNKNKCTLYHTNQTNEENNPSFLEQWYDLNYKKVITYPKYLFIAFMLIVLGIGLFTSCSQDDMPAPAPKPAPSNIEVIATFKTNIKPMINTRSTTTAINGNVYMWEDATQPLQPPKLYNLVGSELKPINPSNNIYLSLTPKEIVACYVPFVDLTSIPTNGIFTFQLANDELNADENKDIVWAMDNFTSTQFGTYNLTFEHLFSLLEVEIQMGNGDPAEIGYANHYYPVYNACGKVDVQIEGTWGVSYNNVGGYPKEDYYFDTDVSTPNIYHAIISSDMSGALRIERNGTSLSTTIKIVDYVPYIQQGYKYRLTVIINQTTFEVKGGNVTVSPWTDGGNSNINVPHV